MFTSIPKYSHAFRHKNDFHATAKLNAWLLRRYAGLGGKCVYVCVQLNSYLWLSLVQSVEKGKSKLTIETESEWN